MRCYLADVACELHDLRARRGVKPRIHRAALVGLDVPAQSVGRPGLPLAHNVVVIGFGS